MSVLSNRGFTLIELLMVITLIGILSAVILTALGGTRTSAGDTAVQANLKNLRTQADLDFYSSNGFCYMYPNTTSCTSFAPFSTFATTCPTSVSGSPNLFADPTVINLINAAKQAGGNIAACNNNVSNKYAVAVKLKSDPSQAWCVDSSGNSMQITFPAPYGSGQLASKLAGAVCNP